MSLVSDPVIVYCIWSPLGAGNLVFTSPDGETWTRMKLPPPPPVPIDTTRFVSFNPDANGGNGRLLFTSEGSNSFTESYHIAISDDGENIEYIAHRIDPPLILGDTSTNARGNVYMRNIQKYLLFPSSTASIPRYLAIGSDEVTWERHLINRANLNYSVSTTLGPQVVYIHELGATFLAAGTTPGGGSSNRIYRTYDGTTWEGFVNQSTRPPATQIAYDPVHNILATTSTGSYPTSSSTQVPQVYVSTDGGDTWQQSGMQFSNVVAGSNLDCRGVRYSVMHDKWVAVFQINNGSHSTIAYADTPNGIWTFVDNSDIGLRGFSRVVEIRRLSRLVALGTGSVDASGHVAYSDDGGVTWTAVEAPFAPYTNLIYSDSLITEVSIPEPASRAMRGTLDMNGNRIVSSAYTLNQSFQGEYLTSGLTRQDLSPDSVFTDTLIQRLTAAGYPPNGS